METFMRNGLFGILLACFLAVPAARAAEVVAPDVLARTVTEDVLASLRASKEIQDGDLGKAAELIETKILPHFNFQAMTRFAMGKNWAQASPAQRQVLTGEFRTLLVRTYTASLTLYRDQTIEYRPVKLTPNDADVVVKSVVRQAGREPISVDYAMEKTENGWKVYDVKIAGISLVGNYRSTFSAEIERGGVDGLIKAIAEKNRARAGKNKPIVQS
ncbi:MAG: ABC transporter substrate-binding protein [Betaproteobacteria bacterium]|nr:ABC transporter substrate-binding protein [Betaproteobacteria bacterium]